MAVDLVGSLPETPKGNRWVLVLMDHFTGWQNAIVIPNATTPLVTTTLDELVFCYLDLLEQGVQFELRVITELCL